MSTGRDHEVGFRKALKEASLPIDEGCIRTAEFDEAKIHEAVDALLAAKVTGVFCAGDSMAAIVLKKLKDKDVSVPDQVAVVGMDNLQVSSLTNPGLTTVMTHTRELAALAAKLTLRNIQTPLINKVSSQDIPFPELVVRESCGAKR